MARGDWVWDFTEGSRDDRELLGGKGANVAEMTRVLGAERIPAGFTITTEACVATTRAGGAWPDGLEEEVDAALERLEAHAGLRLGDPGDPLLVSVRSGARESMPGMLDTVLNLGLNDRSVEGLARTTGNERFAWDSYRRLVQMFGDVVCGVDGADFERDIKAVKADRGVREDTELDTAALRELVERFAARFAFPQDPREQLRRAIDAVFGSWTGERAVRYRRLNGIPDAWGTAVNVQRMVFGNKGDSSGSGVAFSRDEVTGAPQPSGDFLPNAQGEDVVSGVRTPRDIAELEGWLPQVHRDLHETLRTLERHFGDMQDVEFTVEEEQLFLLQTRSAKRPAQAAVRFCVDAVEEGLLSREQAIATIDAQRLDALLHPTFDPAHEPSELARGVAASPGAAKGAIVFTAQDAIDAAARDEAVILVRPFTEADDVAGFHAARGILTSEGGKASHAALVARGMGRPAVTGAGSVEIDLDAREARVGETVLHEGDRVAIDGSTGLVTVDDVPLVEPEVGEHFATVLGWCDELRRLGVRANADDAEAAAKARSFGAQGCGLVRVEHFFLGAEQPRMQAFILSESDDDVEAALAGVAEVVEREARGILEAMRGRGAGEALPVCFRLLDPPLHEFVHEDGLEGRDAQVAAELHEANPMLGVRGVRLGVLRPEITRTQVRALCRAAKAVDGARIELMVPLVAYERELALSRSIVADAAREEGLEAGVDFAVGTMIELPRACFIADRIAEQADFFSFGTNDLTQTGLGFSRDDFERKLLERYLDDGVMDRSPFETIDAPGVGQMVRMGAWLGRQGRADLKLGVCGEHGGDPDSIAFFHDSGLDYVSCSAYRVPIARVAAAQAAVGARGRS